ncbi:MAG: class I SAM-dependent methyltransferase [Candidatus Hydrogenedentes bacterium]|nr:class I SAM-dependent methyltransferase [Candidatus Hydrogenedentota bacterium]
MSFDKVADLYDSIRPGYPDALFKDTIDTCQLCPQSRILEIGCGSGQATAKFAEIGCAITGIEVGENLARIAAKKLSTFTNVEIVPIAFELWEHRGRKFDLAISATAFHWITPEAAYTKTAKVLSDGGHLAIFCNNHVRRNEGFFESVQSIYDRYRPPAVPSSLNGESAPAQRNQALEQSRDELFQHRFTRKYPWSVSYRAEEYTQLLLTYSDHFVLPEETRSRLLNDIRNAIVTDYGGTIIKHYETLLDIWAKKG